MRENPRTVRMRVGRNVRQLRLLRDLSQERLAELVGNNYKHVGQIERGEANVTLDILTRVASALSVSVADLFGPASLTQPPPSPPMFTDRELEQITDALRILDRARDTARKRRITD
jgi:transcriptional regulator with XRE-family HTH domain